MTLKLSSILFFICLFFNYQGFSQWTKVNSFEGGEILKIRKIDNTLFAFGELTFHKSNDNGVTWQDVLIPSTINYNKTWDICISESYMIIAGGKDLFRSNNYGVSWEKMSLTIDSESNIKNVYSDGKVVFVITDKAIFVSKNSGSTWKKTFTPAFGGLYIYYFTAHKGHYYFDISYPSNHYVLTSSDTTTWQTMSAPTNNSYNMLTTVSDTVFNYTTGGLYYTVDQATTWVKKSNGVQNIYPVYPSDNIASSGRTIALSIENKLCISQDGGATWITKDINFHTNLQFSDDKLFGTSSEFTIIDINKNDLSYMPSASGITLLYPTSIATKGSVVYGLVYLYIKGTYYLYISNDNGLTWSIVNISNAFQGFNLSLSNIKVFNDKLFFINSSGPSANVLMSDLDGNNVKKLLSYDSNNSFASISITNNNLYVHTKDSTTILNKSNNTLSKMEITFRPRWITVEGNTFYALEYNNYFKLYKSIDAGLNWTDVSTKISNVYSLLGIHYSNDILYIYSSYGLYKINDTDSKAKQFTYESFISSVDETNDWLVVNKYPGGANKSILIPSTGGLYTIDLNGYSQNVLNVVATNEKFVAFTINGIFISDNLLSTPTFVIPVNCTSDNFLTLKPNPTSDIILLNSELSVDRIEVYDFNGRQVNIDFNKDSNEISLKNIESGLYLIKVYSEGKYSLAKVIKE